LWEFIISTECQIFISKPQRFYKCSIQHRALNGSVDYAIPRGYECQINTVKIAQYLYATFRQMSVIQILSVCF
jgi:hypothetical protein